MFTNYISSFRLLLKNKISHFIHSLMHDFRFCSDKKWKSAIFFSFIFLQHQRHSDKQKKKNPVTSYWDKPKQTSHFKFAFAIICPSYWDVSKHETTNCDCSLKTKEQTVCQVPHEGYIYIYWFSPIHSVHGWATKICNPSYSNAATEGYHK